MELNFRTRDIGPLNDYPAIGWMPPLPEGADRLWRRFGSFGSAEFPQIVLFQKNGRWELYMEGMDSGRTDAATGQGGRVIRTSIYLEGNVSEGASILGLLSVFLSETLAGPGNGSRLRTLFAESIHAGEPRRWKDDGVQVQMSVAQELLAKFIALACVLPVPPAVETGWAAGRSDENIRKFFGSCRAVLCGEADGYAISLPYCRMADAGNISSMLDGERLVALLSGDSAERAAPAIRLDHLRLPSHAREGRIVSESGKDRLNFFFLVALILVVTGLLVKCCSGSRSDTVQKNPSRQEIK